MANVISINIADILRAKGMTQKELADASGINEAAISHYVKGDRIPRGLNLARIADALGVSLDELRQENEITGRDHDLQVAKTLIARNASNMSKQEKMEFVSLLLGELEE